MINGLRPRFWLRYVTWLSHDLDLDLSPWPLILTCQGHCVPGLALSSYSPVLNRLHWLPVRQRVIYKTAMLTYRSLNIGHLSPVGPDQWLHTATSTPIIWPPTTVPANKQHSVCQSRIQLNRTSYLGQFTNITIRTASTTNIFRRHLKTESLLWQHRHWLTVTIRSYDLNFCFDIWRATNWKKSLLVAWLG